MWVFWIHRSKNPGRPSIVFQNCGFSKSIDRKNPDDHPSFFKIVVFQNPSIDENPSIDPSIQKLWFFKIDRSKNRYPAIPTFFQNPQKFVGRSTHRPSIDHPSTTHNHKKPLFSKHIPKHQQPKIQSFSETLQTTVGTAHRFAKKVGIEDVALPSVGFTGLSHLRNGYIVNGYIV
jgi:hypothetical protein